jgi:flagellin-like protein
MARKGVSPVLASLLLVAIAAAAAIATYVRVSSYIGAAERGVEEPQLPILLFKTAVDAAVLLFLLFAVGELAASLWRVSEGLTRSLP